MTATATMEQKKEILGMQSNLEKSLAATEQENQMMSMDAITAAVPTKDPATINTDNITPENKAYVDNIVNGILSQDFANPRTQEDLKEVMEGFQNGQLEQAVYQSEKLNDRMLTMSQTADGGALLDKLTECDQVMNNLHPSNNNTKTKWWHYIPFVMKPMRKYMMLCQTQQDVLQGFKKAIDDGIAERKMDMKILKNDKVVLKQLAIGLENSIQAAMYLDERLTITAANEQDEETRIFLETELVYTLRKTIEALQEQLIVVNQGQMAMEQIIRLLDILCSSAKRTMNVAMLALQISMVIASVLAGAKDLIDKTNKLKGTANDFLAHNAGDLTKVTDAVIDLDTSSTLDMSTVETVFDSIKNNSERSTQARLDNLSVVRERINKYDNINAESKKFVEKLDRGNKAAAGLQDQLGTQALPEAVQVIA
mgnify:CR=1 FL=1